MGLAYGVAMLHSARDELVDQSVKHEPDNEKAFSVLVPKDMGLCLAFSCAAS